MRSDIETRLLNHLTHLCVEIGPRPSGSEENQAAADYIQCAFRAAGLDVEEQRWACPDWQYGETHLAMNGTRLEAVANAFSPPCDVVASAVAVSTVAELEAADLAGHIGILYGDLTKAPLACKSWFLASEQDLHTIRLLEEKAPAALITIQPKPGSLERIIEDWEFCIPSATVGAEEGLALLREEELKVHLRIESERSPGWSCNVVGRKGDAGQPKIVLCAHYDTKFDTPGATDNGGGAAVLLTLAQLLGQREHTLGLEWIAFSGHEYLPLGDDEYLGRYEDSFPRIVAAINFDCVGNILGASSIASFVTSHPFQNHLVELTRDYPGVVWVDPWPQSNHSTFAWRNVPSLALSSVGGGNITHQRIDTIERVSPAKLVEVVSLIGDIVASLQDKSPAWSRPAE
ncbi:MAG: M28 family peptidase [Chloroflexota bacterium]|nr:M28 family peptidase [Chloroflexota bacterium]